MMEWIKNFFKKLICKHDWGASGFSYVRCKTCDAGRYNPGLCSELNNKFMQSMVDAGYWDAGEINSNPKAIIHQLRVTPKP